MSPLLSSAREEGRGLQRTQFQRIFCLHLYRFYNRTASKAEKIADDFRKFFPGIVYENISDAEHLPAVIADSVLVVNTTPAGMTAKHRRASHSPRQFDFQIIK